MQTDPGYDYFNSNRCNAFTDYRDFGFYRCYCLQMPKFRVNEDLVTPVVGERVVKLYVRLFLLSLQVRTTSFGMFSLLSNEMAAETIRCYKQLGSAFE